MRKIGPLTWTHDGRELSVSLFVEDDKVVGMTPVDGAAPASQIIVPGQRYLGDHIASGLSKVGVKPCGGCKKRQQKLNHWHQKAGLLLGSLSHSRS